MEDEFIGRGRIVRHEGDNFRVGMSATDETHLLTRREILVEPTVGAEGRLVLRDAGLFVSYHLIPDA